MTAPRVRADYDALRQMSADWRQQASETAKSLQQLRSQMQTLEGGDWVGQGATAFYGEMNGQVLPTLKRLTDALNAASDTTQKISALMKQAEDEAASCFKLNGAAVAGGAAGLFSPGPGSGAGGGSASGGSGSGSGSGSGGGGSGSGSGSGSGGTVAPAPIGTTMAEKAAAVQKFIDKGDKAGAIKEAIRQYGVDVSSAKTGTPVHNSSVTGEGATSKDGTIKIGDKAFASPGLLATVIGHEHVHAQQAADRWYTGPQGTAINEVEAYDWELKNASRFGLTTAEINTIKARRKAHYDLLNADNKKIVDGGSYVLPAGKTGT